MVGIAFFGLIMIALSFMMIFTPQAWLDRALRFCRLPYMHPLEIAIRLGFGAIFILFADDTRFPVTIRSIGYLLVAVGAALLFLRPSYHRRVGLDLVQRAAKWSRLAGCFSLALGCFLVAAALPQ